MMIDDDNIYPLMMIDDDCRYWTYSIYNLPQASTIVLPLMQSDMSGGTVRAPQS